LACDWQSTSIRNRNVDKVKDNTRKPKHISYSKNIPVGVDDYHSVSIGPHLGTKSIGHFFLFIKAKNGNIVLVLIDFPIFTVFIS
jgi:hypothetical protein